MHPNESDLISLYQEAVQQAELDCAIAGHTPVPENNLLLAAAIATMDRLHLEGIVRKVRDILWPAFERRMACFEAFEHLVLFRERANRDAMERLLPYFDERLLGTKLRGSQLNRSTLARQIARTGAFNISPNIEERDALQNALKDAHPIPPQKLENTDTDVAVSEFREFHEKVSLRLSLMRSLSANETPLSTREYRLAQALASALLCDDSGRLERARRILSSLASRREVAVSIIHQAALDVHVLGRDALIAAENTRSLLASLDPAFEAAELSFFKLAIESVRVDPKTGKPQRGKHAIGPHAALASLVVGLEPRPLDLFGDAARVKTTLLR